MAGITAAGVGTGLDINSIVSQLVSAEKQPEQSRLDNQKSQLQTELSAYGKLKSSLSSVGDALKGLGDLKAGRTASVSDGSVLSAKAGDNAAIGNYSIVVSHLAQAQSLASQDFSSSTATVGTGTINLSVGSGASKTITIDSSNNTLQGIADAINNAGAGVSASIVNDGTGYRLALSSGTTGASNTINLTVTDSDGNNTDTSGLSALASANMTQTVAAQDAKFTVNGLQITSASNTNDSAIQGVTLNLKQASSTPTTVSVNADTSSVVSAVQKLVTAYSSFNKQASQLSAYDPSTQQAGVLLGDSTLRTVAGRLQSALINPVAGAPAAYASLVDVGITTDSNGNMQLDTSKLQAALKDNFGGVVGMLNGAAKSLDTTVNNITGVGGALQSRTDGINTELKRIAQQQTNLNQRMTELQKSLMKQYTAMDTLVAQMQNTSNYLTQQLASLPLASSSSSTSSSSSSSGG